MIYNNIQLTVLPRQAASEDLLKEMIAGKINVSSKRISSVRIIRKSIDARSKVQVKVNLTVDVYTLYR